MKNGPLSLIKVEVRVIRVFLTITARDREMIQDRRFPRHQIKGRVSSLRITGQDILTMTLWDGGAGCTAQGCPSAWAVASVV